MTPPTPPRPPETPTDHYTLANAVYDAYAALARPPQQYRAGREPQAEPVTKRKHRRAET